MKRNECFDLLSFFDTKDFDYHVHIGQFNDKYYEPHKVMEELAKNGIIGCFFSSTTSCMKWDNKNDKSYLLKHIEDEVKEALYTAKKLNIEAKALYWINLFEYLEFINEINFDKNNIRSQVEKYLMNRLESCDYFGFKIHTRADFWDTKDKNVSLILDIICEIANKYNMPILIHSGMDEIENPKRFEKWYKDYNNVKFILAHLKPFTIVIDLMKIYENVYADTAFASEETINLIKDSKLKSRIINGSDYPINNLCYSK